VRSVENTFCNDDHRSFVRFESRVMSVYSDHVSAPCRQFSDSVHRPERSAGIVVRGGPLGSSEPKAPLLGRATVVPRSLVSACSPSVVEALPVARCVSSACYVVVAQV